MWFCFSWKIYIINHLSILVIKISTDVSFVFNKSFGDEDVLFTRVIVSFCLVFTQRISSHLCCLVSWDLSHWAWLWHARRLAIWTFSFFLFLSSLGLTASVSGWLRSLRPAVASHALTSAAKRVCCSGDSHFEVCLFTSLSFRHHQANNKPFSPSSPPIFWTTKLPTRKHQKQLQLPTGCEWAKDQHHRRQHLQPFTAGKCLCLGWTTSLSGHPPSLPSWPFSSSQLLWTGWQFCSVKCACISVCLWLCVCLCAFRIWFPQPACQFAIATTHSLTIPPIQILTRRRHTNRPLADRGHGETRAIYS